MGPNLTGRFQGTGRLHDLDLTIIEQEGRLLPGFPDGMHIYAAKRLRERGVSVQTRTTVQAVEDDDIAVVRTATDRNPSATFRRLRTDGSLPRPDELRTFLPYHVAPLILSTGERQGLWTAGPLWAAHPWLLRLKHWIDRRWIRTYAPERWGDIPWHALLGAEAAVS